MLQQFCSTAKWVDFLLFQSHIISLFLLLFNCSTIASAPSCCDHHICAGVHVCVQGHMAPSSEDWGSSGNILGDIFWVICCCTNKWLQVRCWWWLLEIHINSGHYEHWRWYDDDSSTFVLFICCMLWINKYKWLWVWMEWVREWSCTQGLQAILILRSSWIADLQLCLGLLLLSALPSSRWIAHSCLPCSLPFLLHTPFPTYSPYSIFRDVKTSYAW